MDLAPTPTYEQSLATESQQDITSERVISERPNTIGRGTLTVIERSDAIEYGERGSLTPEPRSEVEDGFTVAPRTAERQDS